MPVTVDFSEISSGKKNDVNFCIDVKIIHIIKIYKNL